MATSKKFVPPVAFHPGKTLSAKLEEMGIGKEEVKGILHKLADFAKSLFN